MINSIRIGCDNIKVNRNIFAILSIIVVTFVLIGSVSATDIDTNDTEALSATDIDANDIESLSENNGDEIVAVENDLDVLSADTSTYSELSNEIGSGGDKNLTYAYYKYDEGSTTININTAGVIDGRGAIIDMDGSNIRAFRVSASGVTIKNLTIKNANYDGDGGAIYFSSSGTVENCNFTDNCYSSNLVHSMRYL